MKWPALCLVVVLGLLQGCREPRLSYDVRADLRAPDLEAFCLDPRTDLAIVGEGQRM